jgi:hypothetical protein
MFENTTLPILQKIYDFHLQIGILNYFLAGENLEHLPKLIVIYRIFSKYTP